jgi:hypothetical protein
MLGVESGASVLDFTGEIEKEVDAYQVKHPFATFDEVSAKFLKDHDGKIIMNQISPRCFEAIALKTPLILFEGNYSGILKPGRHYISLQKDFKNIHDVIKLIRDTNYLQHLADTAYQEIALNPEFRYKHFISYFDQIVDNEINTSQLNPSAIIVTQQHLDSFLNTMPFSTKIRSKIIKIAYNFNNAMPYRIRNIIKSMGMPLLKKLKLI